MPEQKYRSIESILTEVKLGISGKFIRVVGSTSDKQWVKMFNYGQVRF
jgi:hypothetical protein